MDVLWVGNGWLVNSAGFTEYFLALGGETNKHLLPVKRPELPVPVYITHPVFEDID